MKTLYMILIATTIFTISFSAKPIDDDSIKYVSIKNMHLPGEVCINGWAAMINESGHNGGPNKRIRVYYTMNNRPMVCETNPLPPLPDPKTVYMLLGCVGGNYKITRSEYIQ